MNSKLLIFSLLVLTISLAIIDARPGKPGKHEGDKPRSLVANATFIPNGSRQPYNHTESGEDSSEASKPSKNPLFSGQKPKRH